MSDENIFEEFAEVDRKIWNAGGKTARGFLDVCHRYAQEDHARFLAEMEREKAEGTWTPDEDAVPEYAGAVCVHEGDPPNYPTTKLPNGDSDFAHSGAEGDAE